MMASSIFICRHAAHHRITFVWLMTVCLANPQHSDIIICNNFYEHPTPGLGHLNLDTHILRIEWKYAHLFIRLNMCKQKCLNTTFRVHTSRIIQRWILPAHSFNRAKVSVLRGQACVMKYLQICSTMYSGWGWAKYQHWLFKINIILHSQSWILGGVLLCKGTLWNQKPVWID